MAKVKFKLPILLRLFSDKVRSWEEGAHGK
jgi:hypothetical protein